MFDSKRRSVPSGTRTEAQQCQRRAQANGVRLRTRFHQHWQGYPLSCSSVPEDAKLSFHLHFHVGTHVVSGRDHVMHKVCNLPDELVEWFDA